MQDFNNKLNEKTQEIEDIIYSYLPNELNKQKVIMEAMNYSVKAGGKRLRPVSYTHLSGVDGIFLYLCGLGNMFIFLWVETEKEKYVVK